MFDENLLIAFNSTKVDILYSNCSHLTFELNWVFILNFGSFFSLAETTKHFQFLAETPLLIT